MGAGWPLLCQVRPGLVIGGGPVLCAGAGHRTAGAGSGGGVCDAGGCHLAQPVGGGVDSGPFVSTSMSGDLHKSGRRDGNSLRAGDYRLVLRSWDFWSTAGGADAPGSSLVGRADGGATPYVAVGGSRRLPGCRDSSATDERAGSGTHCCLGIKASVENTPYSCPVGWIRGCPAGASRTGTDGRSGL